LNIPQAVHKPAFKMVKNATLFNSDGFYYIQHYDTKIFEYNQKTKEVWLLLNCSRTSNRQIKNALNFFGLNGTEKNVKIEYAPKWSYSGERT